MKITNKQYIEFDLLPKELQDIISFMEINSVDNSIITHENKPLVRLSLIGKQTSKRVGVAKEEMQGRNITLEELNSIKLDNMFS